MSGLSDREQKLLAVGLLILAVTIAWFAVAAPLKAGFDSRRDRREAALSRLRHDERLVAGAGLQGLRQAQVRREARALTLEAQDPRSAARAAQLRIARAAAASGVRLALVRADTSLRPLVRIEADAKGDYYGLSALLQRLQGDVPSAQISHLLMSRSDSFQAETGAPALLDAHLSLTYAYRALP